MTYREWLKEQQGRQDDIGEFARLAIADPTTENYGTRIGYWVAWCPDKLEQAAYEAIWEFEGRFDLIEKDRAEIENAL